MRVNVANISGSPSGARGSKGFGINEIFGQDLLALEGYENYDASLRDVLSNHIRELKKKSSLVPDAPLPPVLIEKRRKEKERERVKADKARQLANAEAEQKAVIKSEQDASAKTKSRAGSSAKARARSANVDNKHTRREALEREVAAKGKLYAEVR